MQNFQHILIGEILTIMILQGLLEIKKHVGLAILLRLHKQWNQDLELSMVMILHNSQHSNSFHVITWMRDVKADGHIIMHSLQRMLMLFKKHVHLIRDQLKVLSVHSLKNVEKKQEY